ncbi:MAG: RNA methyltransferase [Trueperaceae bacterium]|nr:MAG: RNA methyltransferase [Trueperaceae bacterium]
MADEIIRSVGNALVKRLVRLRERREREREGVVLVEGARELVRASTAGWPLDLLVSCPESFSAEATGAAEGLAARAAERRRFAPAAFAKVSMRERPDGLLGVVRPPQLALDDLPWPRDGLYLVIAGVEKPGNVGALLRSADAVGVDAVFVTGGGTDLGNPNVVRSSMGSLFTQAVLAVDDEALRAALRHRGVRLVATSPAADRSYWSARLEGSVAVVVGPEHVGLDEPWLAAADEVVAIPMRGAADSLNAATAGALVLFEALRRRSGQGIAVTDRA